MGQVAIDYTGVKGGMKLNDFTTAQYTALCNINQGDFVIITGTSISIATDVCNGVAMGSGTIGSIIKVAIPNI